MHLPGRGGAPINSGATIRKIGHEPVCQILRLSSMRRNGRRPPRPSAPDNLPGRVLQGQFLVHRDRRDLVGGYGFRNTQGFDPPGFPSLLALVSMFGPDPQETAPFVNAVVFGLTVVVAGVWFRLRIKSRILVVGGTCATAFSTALSLLAAMPWSVAPFCLFLVLSLFSLDRYLSTDNRRVHSEKEGRLLDQRMLWPFVSRALACGSPWPRCARAWPS